MKHNEIRGAILDALADTNPLHAMRDSELTARVGLGLRFIARALTELHQEGKVANRDVWPPDVLPYKCYWRVAAVAQESLPAASQPEPAGKDACATCSDGLAVPEKRARVRVCMCCPREFLSQGPHNRLCGPCRGKSVGPYDL